MDPVAPDSQQPSVENTLSWYRIIPYRSVVRWWKSAPATT